jgi:hypothetical protein
VTAEGHSEESRGSIADATARIDFCVDDGSGALAHVALANAKMIEPALVWTPTSSLSPPLAAFVRGDRAKGDAPGCSVVERALFVDDEVIVLGPARRVAGRLILGDGATPLIVSRVPLASPSEQLGILAASLMVIGLALFPFLLRLCY